jgi:Domain of unknown function (DUF389)
VIRIEVFGQSSAMADVARLLDETDDASRVMLGATTRPGHAVVQATIHPRAVDEVLQEVRRLGVPDAHVTLMRLEVLGRSKAEAGEAGLVWEDVLGMASRNSRPIARYLVFMLAAGLIASYGVIEYNEILIVGASLAAVASAFAQDQFNRIPSTFNFDSTVLGSLTRVNNETIVVALAAGVAGMRAPETRASSGVGVAVSVTTIPAAAYLGVAFGLGRTSEAWGALAVLGTNVAMLVVAASGTLALQRTLAHRASAKQPPARERARS